MSQDTVSSTEILRLCAALLGIVIAWKGRKLVQAQVFHDPLGLPSLVARLWRGDWDDRMRLYQALQVSIIGVHVLLLINVTTNMFYAGPSIEQPNIATSNIMQLVIPAIMIRASEMISEKVRKTARTFDYANIGQEESS